MKKKKVVQACSVRPTGDRTKWEQTPAHTTAHRKLFFIQDKRTATVVTMDDAINAGKLSGSPGQALTNLAFFSYQPGKKQSSSANAKHCKALNPGRNDYN